MNLAPIEKKGRGGKGRGTGRGKGRGGKGGPGRLGQVGPHNARQASGQNRSFGGAYYTAYDNAGRAVKGTQVPGSINAATRDADTTFQLRSRNECLCDCTYEGNPIGLQRAICHILQIEHDHGGGPRRKLYQRMPHEESGDFRAVGKMWASKITEISKDYQSVAPPHTRYIGVLHYLAHCAASPVASCLGDGSYRSTRLPYVYTPTQNHLF